MSDVTDLAAAIEKTLADAIRPSAIKLMAGEMTAQEARTAYAVANGIAAKVRAAMAPYVAPSTTPAVEEQPGFLYFECDDCQFDSVQTVDFKGSEYCPLCASDNGRDNRMTSRVAKSTDKPEGFDARKGPRETQMGAEA